MKIDLSNLSQIILNGIFDQELDNQIRVDILGNVPEELYEMACDIFHEAREVYFDLGFIDNSYNKENENPVRKGAMDRIKSKHYNIACEVFEATRVAYFDLGFDTRKTLRHE